jgi:hypothetical protein
MSFKALDVVFVKGFRAYMIARFAKTNSVNREPNPSPAVRRTAEANFISDVEIWKTQPTISPCFPHSNINNNYY